MAQASSTVCLGPGLGRWVEPRWRMSQPSNLLELGFEKWKMKAGFRELSKKNTSPIRFLGVSTAEDLHFEQKKTQNVNTSVCSVSWCCIWGPLGLAKRKLPRMKKMETSKIQYCWKLWLLLQNSLLCGCQVQVQVAELASREGRKLKNLQNGRELIIPCMVDVNIRL